MNKQARFSIVKKPAVAALSTLLMLSTFSITRAIAGSEQMPEAKTADANSATNKTSTEDKIPDGAEKDAWMLLKAAHDARQVMPSNFEGFDAKVVFTQDDTKYNGTMSYRKSTGTKIDVPDLKGEPLEWLTDKLASFIGHRRGDSFAEGDGRNPITFGAEDKSPYGRLVELHDRLNSKYRIKDNKVREVTRTTPESTFTISVIETMEADPGKYL